MTSTEEDGDVNMTVEKEQSTLSEWRINLQLESVLAPKKTDYSKPFMLRFDAKKVGSPFTLMDKETGKDPEWTVVGMYHQLFDPPYETRNERLIAIWHNKANAAWFPEHGFLKENENNPGEFEWTWKPTFDPFQKKKSKISYTPPRPSKISIKM